jgi:hypothetical protein
MARKPNPPPSDPNATRESRFNPDRAARALVHALMHGDAEASAVFDITVRSLQGWRAKMREDDELRALFSKHAAEAGKAWDLHLLQPLMKGMEFLTNALTQLDTTDPEAVTAATGAMQLLIDSRISLEIIRAPTSAENGTPPPAGGPVESTPKA